MWRSALKRKEISLFKRLASKNFAPERESSYMGFPPLERAAELKLADVPFMCIHTHLQRKFYDYYDKLVDQLFIFK